MPETLANKAADGLTDGTGVSKLDAKKLIKDAVLDFLLAAPAALLISGISALPADEKGWVAAGFALATAGIKALYRMALRWAQSE